MVNSITTF